MEHDDHNITVDSQFLELCGITASTELRSRIWHYTHEPERFASVTSRMQDYATAFTPTGDVRDLIARARIDAILIMSLALSKNKWLNSAEVSQQRRNGENRLETLFWGHEQVISLQGLSLNPCDIRYAVMDDVLWYGDPGKLETSLIVVRTEELRDDAGMRDVQYLAVLAAIAMIQHNRAKESVLDETYGILTDGVAWIFFHIDKDHKYSSLRLDWLEGQQQAIVGLIGRIIDDSVTVKLTGEQLKLNQLPWTFEWSRMARIWDISHCDYFEEEKEHEYSLENSLESSPEPSLNDSLNNENEDHQPNYQLFNEKKMEWFFKMEKRILEILRRAKRTGKYDSLEEQINKEFKNARSESQKGKKEKAIPSIAVTDIPATDVLKMFKLKREDRSAGRKHWEIAPTERRTISSHLKRNLENIRLMYGRANENEALIRLTIDAILLHIMASIKRVEYNQYGEEKGPGKRASSETTTFRKSLQMSIENPIMYVYNTAEGKKQVKGRMDYILWYGQRNEAETNLMVVEAKAVGGVQAGRYQAISYMTLIQDARRKTGRAKIPIYGIATDTRNWEFIWMDANRVVDVHALSWDGKEDNIVISLIHKIVHEASCLSPVSSNTLNHQKTVEELTGLLLTKN